MSEANRNTFTTDRVASAAHETVDKVAASAAQAEERLRKVAADLEQRIHETSEKAKARGASAGTQAKELMTDHPVASLGVAFVAGVLAAALLRRS